MTIPLHDVVAHLLNTKPITTITTSSILTLLTLVLYRVHNLKQQQRASQWISGGAYIPPKPELPSQQEKILQWTHSTLSKFVSILVVFTSAIWAYFRFSWNHLLEITNKAGEKESFTSTSSNTITSNKSGVSSDQSKEKSGAVFIPQSTTNGRKVEYSLRYKNQSSSSDTISPTDSSINSWSNAVFDLSRGSDSDGSHNQLSGPNLPSTNQIRPKRLSYSGADASPDDLPEQRPQVNRSSILLESARNLNHEENIIGINALPTTILRSNRKHGIDRQLSREERKRRRVSFGQDQVRLFGKDSPLHHQKSPVLSPLCDRQEIIHRGRISNKRSSESLVENVTKVARREGDENDLELSLSWNNRAKLLRNQNGPLFQVSSRFNNQSGRTPIRLSSKQHSTSSFPITKTRGRETRNEDQVLAALLKASQQSNEMSNSKSPLFTGVTSSSPPKESQSIGENASNESKRMNEILETKGNNTVTFNFSAPSSSETKENIVNCFGSNDVSNSGHASTLEVNTSSSSKTFMFGSQSNDTNGSKGSSALTSSKATFTFGLNSSTLIDNSTPKSTTSFSSGSQGSSLSVNNSSPTKPGGFAFGASQISGSISGGPVPQTGGSFAIGGSQSSSTSGARRSALRRRRTSR